MPEQPVSIRVSEVGEFIRFRSCERRFKLGLGNRALARSVPFSERLFNSLDPVLQEVGREAEDAWAQALIAQGARALDPPPVSDEPSFIRWSDLCSAFAELRPGEVVFAREVSLSGIIGAFDVSGRADFVVVVWSGSTPLLRIVEGKASRKDRTYHRIQLAAYLVLIRQALEREPMVIAGQRIEADALEGVVVRIDEITNEPQDMLGRPALNLDTEIADLVRMLAGDGALAYIERTELDRLDFQLDLKCDGCVFNVHCFPESARQRRLELVGIAPTTSRSLRQAGVPDLDALAALDPASPTGIAVRQTPGFDGDLGQLVALAVARRATLPRGPDQERAFVVAPLPHAGQGQLPPHEAQGRRLVRIYLEVDYDYTENRVGALAAHVTSSDWQLRTPFGEDSRPRAGIVEVDPTSDQGAAPASRAVAGRDVFTFQTQPWTGIGDQDTGAERQMIQQFLFDVVEAIAEAAGAPTAPIHFYVYSRSEMTQLVEACTRAGSNLLTSLRQLLGSRESLEQLIFSCVQDEVDDRFALGWTSRGLCVATSLTWFGQVYHWKRTVIGEEVDLDRVFEQDVFDFRTSLDLDAVGGWARGEADAVARHRFEIRSRFHDTLTAPYWRAVWGSLPDYPDADHRTREAIRRYRRAEAPGLLRSYLIARVHALRWLDERVRFKNEEIEKPALTIAELRGFNLGVDTTARAAIDFLRLDHHVRMTDWVTTHIRPPAARVQAGRTIPLRDVRTAPDRTIVATFDTASFGLTPAEVSMRTSFDVGSFVRLSPRAADPDRGQTIRQLLAGGVTCVVQTVDWVEGTIALDAMYTNQTDYILRTWRPDASVDVYSHASLDESPSDFVAGNVEARLAIARGRHVFDWFEPSSPTIPAITPVPPTRLAKVAGLLSSWRVPHPVSAAPLTRDQADAVLEGLGTRVQLLKGPPGTGKTVTTAASILSRIAARLSQGGVVLVAAHTHLAVDTLMSRLGRFMASFRAEAGAQSLGVPAVTLARVHSSAVTEASGDGIEDFSATSCAMRVKNWRAAGVLVVGGTTNALLKMARELSSKKPYSDMIEGFTADMLVVDEASMMVFPHFLSLATMVKLDGEIMLAGDNRQLAPIVAHDWENEDRPPAQHYQPFKSAYESVLRIIADSRPSQAACRQSSLTYTFRLPPIIRELISRIYGNLDDIALEGPDRQAIIPDSVPAGNWEDVWRDDEGLVLVVHSERSSRQSNPIEADIVETIMAARAEHEPHSIAVITPHRAQRALLKSRLESQAHAASIIDTVEKVQGGERPTIIVSGTESDPHAIGAAASFILNLNRANVAFSRTQEKLIVVCAETLLDHVPTELEDYESALLWKSLRNLCRRTLFVAQQDGFRVRVLGPVIRN